MRTSATDVSIHAVSPELPVHFSITVAEQLGGGAGAAGAAAAGAAGGAGAAAAGAGPGPGAGRGRGGGRRSRGGWRRLGRGRGGGSVVLRDRSGRGEADENGRGERWSEAAQ